MDKSTARARIDEIDAILAEGVAGSSIGGLSTQYDLNALSRERNRLQSYLNRGSGGRNVRVGRYNSAYSD